MSDKSAREVAFLRDLYIDNDWTARFTSILDENLILPEDGSLLYVEPGSGNHLLGLPEKLNEKVALFSVHQNIELLKIAKAKAQVINAEIEFQTSENNYLPYSDEEFSTIIADASFITPKNLPTFLTELYRVAEKDAHISFFLPTAGSFGEFFSILWEVLFSAGLEDLGAQIEALIGDIPQISQAEEIAKIAGLDKVQTKTKTELFEYENGTEFMDSFLATEFLLPHWLHFLTAEQKEKIVPEIIRTIDEDRTTMTFRLSIKASVINGKKI